jgi:hypothetical protein
MLYWWFHFKKKSQSISYLLNGSEHIYWILDLENEVHSIWVIWTSNLQECKGHAMVGVGQGWDMLGSGDWGSGFSGVTLAHRYDACNARRRYLESPINYHMKTISKWQHNIIHVQYNVFFGTNSIIHNISYIHSECEKYFMEYC